MDMSLTEICNQIEQAMTSDPFLGRNNAGNTAGK